MKTMETMSLYLAVFALSIVVVFTEKYPLYGQRSTSQVIKNDCVDQSKWNITVYPDPAKKLKGVPYTQMYRGTPECEPHDILSDSEGNPIYTFLLNIHDLHCGITRHIYPRNATTRVTIVLPFRTDGIEVKEDHILMFECTPPDVYWHYNESVGVIDPAFTDYNPNKTDDREVAPPVVRVTVLRGNLEMMPGDQAFLGETLTMRVEVIDEASVYTKVKVQELWATYRNDPLSNTRIDLLTDGCSLESSELEAGIPIFENFLTTIDEATIEADFRVFRFAGQQNLYFWLTITSCSYVDTETCVLCIDARRRKRYAAPYLTQTADGRWSGLAFTHQAQIGEVKLLHVHRIKRKSSTTTKGLKPNEFTPQSASDETSTLSGMTNYQLVVYNPAELPQTEGQIETDIKKPGMEIETPVGVDIPDICLTIAQTIVFSSIAVSLVLGMCCISTCLFCKLRRTHKQKALLRYIQTASTGVNPMGTSMLGSSNGSVKSGNQYLPPGVPLVRPNQHVMNAGTQYM